MGRHRIYVTDDSVEGEVKLRARTYSENEPLKLAQKMYYQRNKEERLEQNREYYPTWLASKDINEFKAKQKETQRKYHNKKRELTRLKQQESETTDEDKVAMCMELFNEIFKT